MDTNKTTKIGLTLYGVLVAIVLVATIAEILHQKGYKQGQIDCINGNVKFESEIRIDTLYIQKPE
jgi:hypothetical protein